MKEFLYLFRGGSGGAMDQSAEAMQQSMTKWTTWMDKLAKDGKLVGGQPLTTDGKVVYQSGKKVTDGPFAEGKEVIGGYLLVKAADYNEAVDLSKACPIFDNGGIVEVREIQVVPM